MPFVKILFFLFFIFLLRRIYLTYRLIKNIKDQAEINGERFKRTYYGFGNPYAGREQSSSPFEQQQKKTDDVEAEYRVIKD